LTFPVNPKVRLTDKLLSRWGTKGTAYYKGFPIMLTFDDGVTIDTSGPLHCLTLDDGEYIVGEGVCIPVKEGEAGAVLHKMQNILNVAEGRG